MRSVQIENFYVCLVMLTVLCEGIAVPLCEAENAETPVKEHFQTITGKDNPNFNKLNELSLEQTSRLNLGICFMIIKFCFGNLIDAKSILKQQSMIDGISYFKNINNDYKINHDDLINYIENTAVRKCTVHFTQFVRVTNTIEVKKMKFFISAIDVKSVEIFNYELEDSSEGSKKIREGSKKTFNVGLLRTP